MRSLLFLAALAVALPACSMNDCCSAFYAFDGITETDAEGTVTGEVDDRDWNVYPGPGTEVPSEVWVSPATPNPATDYTEIEILLPAPDELRITLQRENTDSPIVRILDGAALAAGVHRLRIDRPADAPGLFNVTVTGSTFSTVGDVRFE